MHKSKKILWIKILILILLPCVSFSFSKGYATDEKNLSKLKDEKEFIIYTIKSGDSLSKLAKRYYGDPKKFYLIEEYNELKNSNRVIVGQKIKIPKIVKSFTLSQKASSTGRTIQQNLNQSDNNKKFYYLYSKTAIILIVLIIGTIFLIYIIKKSRSKVFVKDKEDTVITYDSRINKYSSKIEDNYYEEPTDLSDYYIVDQETVNITSAPMLEKDIQADFGRDDYRSSREIWAELRANTTENNLKQGIPVNVYSAICCYETEKAFCIRGIGEGNTLFLPKTQIKIEFDHVYFDREVAVTLTIPKWLAHKKGL